MSDTSNTLPGNIVTVAPDPVPAIATNPGTISSPTTFTPPGANQYLGGPQLFNPPAPTFDSIVTPPADTAVAPTVQNLGNVITNPTARRIIYGAYVIGLLLLGAVATYILATGQKIPVQIVGVTAVFAFLGIPFGSLALSNTPRNK